MTSDTAKDAFRRLSQQEKEHQQFLERYQREGWREGILNKEQVIDYKIAEHLDLPEISLDMQLKDVFLLAANHEYNSHKFYIALAGLHPPGEVRKLLEHLGSMELEHKQELEFLYTEVAFPQTNGG
jgi:rubrerythrin